MKAHEMIETVNLREERIERLTRFWGLCGKIRVPVAKIGTSL